MAFGDGRDGSAPVVAAARIRGKWHYVRESGGEYAIDGVRGTMDRATLDRLATASPVEWYPAAGVEGAAEVGYADGIPAIPEPALEEFPEQDEPIASSPNVLTNWLPEMYRNPKHVGVAYTLWLIGWHYAYLGMWRRQATYVLTLWGLGLWWAVEAFRVPTLVKRHNETHDAKPRKERAHREARVAKPKATPPAVPDIVSERHGDEWVAIDAETATSESGSVCAIGFGLIRDGKLVHFERRLVRPPGNRHDFTGYNGIDAGMTKREPAFGELAGWAEGWVSGRRLVGYSVGFDTKCLGACLAATGRQRSPWASSHDLVPPVKECLAGERGRMTAERACSLLGVPHSSGMVAEGGAMARLALAAASRVGDGTVGSLFGGNRTAPEEAWEPSPEPWKRDPGVTRWKKSDPYKRSLGRWVALAPAADGSVGVAVLEDGRVSGRKVLSLSDDGEAMEFKALLDKANALVHDAGTSMGHIDRALGGARGIFRPRFRFMDTAAAAASRRQDLADYRLETASGAFGVPGWARGPVGDAQATATLAFLLAAAGGTGVEGLAGMRTFE